MSDNTIKSLQQLKNTIRKIEFELHRKEGFGDYEIGILNRFQDYLKNHLHENLVESGEIIFSLQILAKDVEREINQIEDLLRCQNLKYGTVRNLSGARKQFIAQINHLFAEVNKRGTFE